MASYENKNESNRLVELSGSDYKIADGQPNIKGWTVKDKTGRTFGDVDELIFSPATRSVRYLVIDLDDNEFNLDSRKILVPIGLANLHEKDDDVILSGVTAEQLQKVPKYEKGTRINSSTESTIRNIYVGSSDNAATDSTVDHDDEFYKHDHFNEEKFYGNRRPETSKNIPIIEENVEIGKREQETGGVHIKSEIIEEDVEENINLREEHVHVNRKPADRPATEGDLETFQEGDMEVRAHKEVPVVNKEARVVEEVKVNKTVSEDEQTVRDTERRTQVDTKKLDRDNRDDVGNFRDDRRNTEDPDNPDSNPGRTGEKW